MSKSMNEAQLLDAMDELENAEDFFQFFGLAFDPHVVQVNRLHILQRFHNSLVTQPREGAGDAYSYYAALLRKAYQDFVGSSAQEQKVLKVFQPREPGFVSIDDFH